MPLISRKRCLPGFKDAYVSQSQSDDDVDETTSDSVDEDERRVMTNTESQSKIGQDVTEEPLSKQKKKQPSKLLEFLFDELNQGNMKTRDDSLDSEVPTYLSNARLLNLALIPFPIPEIALDPTPGAILGPTLKCPRLPIDYIQQDKKHSKQESKIHPVTYLNHPPTHTVLPG
uniref:Uncharacterized protein n=1 Tax=Amphimedon queenslandica TaxID=400682 RepID=A0A1X7UXG5_AMPQE